MRNLTCWRDFRRRHASGLKPAPPSRMMKPKAEALGYPICPVPGGVWLGGRCEDLVQ